MSLRAASVRSVYLLCGSLVGAAMQWVILLIIARDSGAAGAGQYALAQAVVIPTSYLAWLALRQQMSVYRDDEFHWGDYVALRAFAPALLYLAVLIALMIVWGMTQQVTLTASVFLLKFAEGFFDLAFGRLQSEDRTRAILTSSVLRAALSIPVFLGALALGASTAAAIAAMAVSWLVMYFAIDHPRLGRSTASPTQRSALPRIGALLWRSAPLGMAGLVMSISSNIPRFALDYYEGAAQLGYFAAASHFLVIGGLATTSIGQAVLPMLSHRAQDGDRAGFFGILISVSALITLCGLLAAPFAWLIGDPIMTALYGPAFAGQRDVLVAGALAAGPMFAASFLAFSATAIRAAHIAAWIYALMALVTAALAVVLVPGFGAIGAFAVVGVAGLCQSLLFLAAARRSWGRRPQCGA